MRRAALRFDFAHGSAHVSQTACRDGQRLHAATAAPQNPAPFSPSRYYHITAPVLHTYIYAEARAAAVYFMARASHRQRDTRHGTHADADKTHVLRLGARYGTVESCDLLC